MKSHRELQDIERQLATGEYNLCCRTSTFSSYLLNALKQLMAIAQKQRLSRQCSVLKNTRILSW